MPVPNLKVLILDDEDSVIECFFIPVEDETRAKTAVKKRVIGRNIKRNLSNRYKVVDDILDYEEEQGK